MIEPIENPLVDFKSSAPKRLLLSFGAAVLVCLFTGFIMALVAGNVALSLIFLLSAVGITFFSWLNLSETRKDSAGRKINKLKWEIASPDTQHHKLNVEVSELAVLLDVPDEQMSDLLSAYIVAEDLALRQIQHETKTPLMRHVSIFGTSFDAVFVNQNLITCAEVAFVVTPEMRQEKIDFILSKIASVNERFKQMNADSRVRLLLILVTQLDRLGEAELRSTLKDKFAETMVDVDIELLDFENLQKTYAMD